MSRTYNSAFVLTGDEPISAPTLKRLLLTHNKVYFSDVNDEAIINEKEVFERFPNMTVCWGARGHYPRVPEYKERYSRCLKGSETALNRTLLQPIESRNIRTIDPGMHWMSYNASLSNKDLVNAAAIDATIEKPNLSIPNTIFCGAEVSPSGAKSKYSFDYKDPTELIDVHEGWSWISRLRVGRALKSIRIAQALNASPIAIDSINSEICYALMQQSSPFKFTNDALMDFAIDADIVDVEKLEANLIDVPWDDILKIRKEILPAVSKTKDFLNRNTNIISNNEFKSVDQYIRALNELKSSLIHLKEQEYEAWESLRIGSILKIGGATGSIGLGTLAIPTLTAFPSVLVSLICAGLISAAALSPELKKLIPARRKLREHPLYLIEKLTK